MKPIFTLVMSAGLLLASYQTVAAADAHHVPGIFLGYTHAHSENEFTYGIEYEYKFNSKWGAGLVYEKIDDAYHGAGIDVVLASVYLHPWKDLRVGLGFGQETVGSYTDHSDPEHPHHHKSHDEELIRTSISYDFHVGNFGIAPTLAVDFIGSEKAYVFGVAFVRPF